MDGHTREQMVADLIQHHLRIGMPKSEVTNLLGSGYELHYCFPFPTPAVDSEPLFYLFETRQLGFASWYPSLHVYFDTNALLIAKKTTRTVYTLDAD